MLTITITKPPVFNGPIVATFTVDPRPVLWGQDDSHLPDPPDNFDAWHALPEGLRERLAEKFERGCDLEWDRRQAARVNLIAVQKEVIEKQRQAKRERQMKFRTNRGRR